MSKPFSILLSIFSTDEKILSEVMNTSFATRSPASNLVVTDSTTAGSSASFKLMADQATAALMRHPQTKFSDLSYAALVLQITKSAPTDQEPLQLQSVKIENRCTRRQPNHQVGSLENNSASPQELLLVVYLSLVENKALTKCSM